MDSKLVASFHHYGAAPFEVEALFSILNGPFTVREREVERNYNDDYACMMDIHFPLEFNYDFFQTFGRKRWDKITFLIKEMRRRTGKKGIMLMMNFAGRPGLSFTIAMHEENLFEFALDKMEIIIELVSLQTGSRILPEGIEKVCYEFEPDKSKWKPTMALGKGVAFKYVDDKWILSNQL